MSPDVPADAIGGLQHDDIVITSMQFVCAHQTRQPAAGHDYTLLPGGRLGRPFGRGIHQQSREFQGITPPDTTETLAIVGGSQT